MSNDDFLHAAKRQRLLEKGHDIEDEGADSGDSDIDSDHDEDSQSDEDAIHIKRDVLSELIDPDLPWNSRLCDHCQRWNARQHDPENDVFFQRSGPDRTAEVYRDKSIGTFLGECSSCIICSAIKEVLDNAITQHRHDEDFDTLRVANCGPYYPRTTGEEALCKLCKACDCDCTAGYEQDCDFFVLLHSDPAAAMKQYLLADYRVDVRDTALAIEGSAVVRVRLRYRTSKGELTAVHHRKLRAFADIAALRQLLKDCEAHHGTACQPESGKLPVGFRLIDVEDMCIVEPVMTSRAPAYVALSYIWRDAAHEESDEFSLSRQEEWTTARSMKSFKVPKLIREAMTLCRDLGQRYLWTDRYCIAQDNEEEVERQVNAMDQIYSAAKLTIVAAAESPKTLGFAGVGTTPRQGSERRIWKPEPGRVLEESRTTVVDLSKWNRRAWTFQERALSRRLIYVCDHRIYFQCAQGWFEEDFGHIDDPVYADPTRTLRTYLHWDYVLREYVGRQFTYDSDLLRAFQGLSNRAARQLDTNILFGLPEKFFFLALLWDCTATIYRRTEPRLAPSWSWAGWKWLTYGSYSSHYIPGDYIIPASVRRTSSSFHVNRVGLGLLPIIMDLEMEVDEHVGHDTRFVLSKPPTDTDAIATQHRRIAESIDGALVFRTEVAAIRLVTHECKTTTRPPLITLSSAQGRSIGMLSKFSPIDTEDCTSSQYTLTILGEGELDPMETQISRRMEDRSAIDDTETTWFDDFIDCFFVEMEEAQWPSNDVYFAMLVQPHPVHEFVYERVAIGMVFKDLWKLCEPEVRNVIIA